MMVPIYRPDNLGNLALAESILSSEDIPYFVHNRHFGGLYPGVQIGLYNVMTVMVPEADLLRAREALAMLSTTEQESPRASRSSPRQIFRMVFETLVFGWFIPAKGRRKDSKTFSDDDIAP